MPTRDQEVVEARAVGASRVVPVNACAQRGEVRADRERRAIGVAQLDLAQARLV